MSTVWFSYRLDRGWHPTKWVDTCIVRLSVALRTFTFKDTTYIDNCVHVSNLCWCEILSSRDLVSPVFKALYMVIVQCGMVRPRWEVMAIHCIDLVVTVLLGEVHLRSRYHWGWLPQAQCCGRSSRRPTRLRGRGFFRWQCAVQGKVRWVSMIHTLLIRHHQSTRMQKVIIVDDLVLYASWIQSIMRSITRMCQQKVCQWRQQLWRWHIG